MTEVTYSDIEAAAARIASVCRVTPLLESKALNERTGRRILVKAECLQHTGSFKLRGAYNRMAQLSRTELQRGVVAYSSGNHAQAVAAAARMLGTSAVVVMPADTPTTKMELTRAQGAEIRCYDRQREDRVAIAMEIARAESRVLVPPFDDPRIIAGAGTMGRELALQARELGVDIDALLMGVSGGGLISGSALAFEALSPATAVYGVEPAGFDDTARSLAAGHRVANAPGVSSICDALLVQMPGELTFPILRRLLRGMLTVTDEEVRAAMAAAKAEFDLVVEPGGAVGLAAALNHSARLPEGTLAVVCSGGNA